MNLKMSTSDALSGAGAALRGMRLSVVEIVFLVAGLTFAGVVAYFYLTQAQPRTSRLAELRERQRVAQEKINRQGKEREAVEEQRKNADSILDSLKDFESRLKDSKHGISAVIDEVNGLARANNVSAGDINFRTDAPEPVASATEADGTAASPSPSAAPTLLMRDGKPVNVYEGLGIETTVEGDYHDLRRFISAFEQSRQFVIINSIALQSVDEKAKQTGARRGGPPTRMPGQMAGPAPGQMPGQPLDGPTVTTVSLKIQMETYFQREPTPDPPARTTMTSAPARNR
jgi:Tfp pilus assembly protein PilO